MAKNIFFFLCLFLSFIYAEESQTSRQSSTIIRQLKNSPINYRSKHKNNPPNRGPSFPYISGDSFRAIADHIYDETHKSLYASRVKDGDIVFVKTDFMNTFFTHIHPRIHNKYILITHNSDAGAPGKFAHLLKDPKIIQWFGMNPTIPNNKKFTAIPIGIANQMWKHGRLSTFNTLLDQSATPERTILLGINFSPTPHGKYRRSVFEHFSRASFCKNISSKFHSTYLNNMQNAKFIISPQGNGLDCHRTWEALLMGAIPIVKSSNLNSMFQDMPVLIVKDWKDVTQEYLEKKNLKFSQKPFNYEKIFFGYWFKLITSESARKTL